MPNVEQTEDQTEAGYILDAEGRLVPDYDQTIIIFDDGDIVNGSVVKIDRDEILVDIGYKSEGVIPIRELSIRKDINPDEVVSIGDEIDALVLQKEDKDGRLILSKKRAEYEKSWIRIEELSKSEEVISGRVIEVVKGGLILDIGLRGFLPASLVDVRRVKDLQQFVGQDLECKVIEMDRNRNNVVVSRRSVIDEARKQEREKVMASLEKGEVCTGTVSSIVDFGAFVDLGGIDGLIHISEMSWTHVDHPSEILTMGDDINVKVLDIDEERGRISLGLKQCQDDPWKDKIKDLVIGENVEGKVSKLVSFGVFVELFEGVEGLVHISELAHEHIEKPEDAVSAGEQVTARIVDIDADRRRVSLSIRRAEEPIASETSDDEEKKTEVVAAEAPVEPEPEKKEKKAAKAAKAATKTAAKTSDDSKSDEATQAVLESGDSDEAAGALGEAESVDEKTSQAIDEALKLDTEEEDLSKLSGEVAETSSADEDDSGSLEDVLEKMKETNTSTD